MLEQVHLLDMSLERAAEAYNLATIELGGIERRLAVNRRQLLLARTGLRRARATLSARVVALYKSGDTDPTLEVMLGATSLDDLLNRIETADRVSALDARVVREIVQYRNDARERSRRLSGARSAQRQVVAERAQHRASVLGQLAQRRSLLSSIEGEIARLQAAERARQVRLAREAQARLAAEQRARALAVARRPPRVARAVEKVLAVAPSAEETPTLVPEPSLAETPAEVRAAPRPTVAEEPPAAAVAVADDPIPPVVEESETVQEEAIDEVHAPDQAAPPEPPALPDPVEEAPAPPRYGGVVGTAMGLLGIPYLWGGSSPDTGFDCSGFIMYVYLQAGVSLPHNAAAQYGLGTPVAREDLQPGDLVFFDGLGHNGIYIGGDQFIHSPHTGDVVKISGMSEGWYASGYVGARRL